MVIIARIESGYVKIYDIKNGPISMYSGYI